MSLRCVRCIKAAAWWLGGIVAGTVCLCTAGELLAGTVHGVLPWLLVVGTGLLWVAAVNVALGWGEDDIAQNH